MGAIIKKKRGRPKGSKNKANKKAFTAANDSFAEAFRDTSPSFPPERNEEEENFAMNDDVALYEGDITDDVRLSDMVAAADQLDAAESETNEEHVLDLEEELEEGNIGFGNADIFDVEDLIVLAGDTKIGNNEKDVFQDLRDSCVAPKSQNGYLSAIIILLYHNYKLKQHLLHRSWVKTLNSFSFNIEDEKKKEKVIKKTIKKMLLNVNENAPPINFETYTAKDYMTYLLSLQRKRGILLRG